MRDKYNVTYTSNWKFWWYLLSAFNNMYNKVFLIVPQTLCEIRDIFVCLVIIIYGISKMWRTLQNVNFGVIYLVSITMCVIKFYVNSASAIVWDTRETNKIQIKCLKLYSGNKMIVSCVAPLFCLSVTLMSIILTNYYFIW